MSGSETIVSISPGSGIDIWNLASGSLKQTIKLQADSISSTPLFVDGEHILVRVDRQLVIVNLHSGNIKSRSTISDSVCTATLSHDRQYLVGGSESGRVYVWFFPSGELIRVFDAHYKALSNVAFSDDDAILITTSLDGSCSIWVLSQVLNIHALQQSTSLQGRLTPLTEFTQHSLPISSIVVGSSITSGGRLFTSSLDSTVVEYHLPTKSVRNVYNLASPVTALCLSRNELFLYAGCADGSIHAIPLYDTHKYRSSNTPGGIDILSSRPAIASPSLPREPGVDHTNGLSDDNDPSLQPTSTPYEQFIGHSGRITSLSTSLHDNLLVSSSTDGIRIWMVTTKQTRNVLTGLSRHVSCSGVSIDLLSHLNATDDKLRKKEFPMLTRLIRTPLHIHQNPSDLMPGTNCFTGVPVSLPVNPRNIINDDNYSTCTMEDPVVMDQLYALIDSKQ